MIAPAKVALEVPVAVPACRSGTLLVVEEHEALRFAIGLTLQVNGYDVIAALAARQALAIAEEYRPEAIVIDLCSGLDAWWLAGAIRNHVHLAGTPLVGILSGHSSVPPGRARSAGFVTLIKKPFGAEELLRAVKACMAEPPRFRRSVEPNAIA